MEVYKRTSAERRDLRLPPVREPLETVAFVHDLEATMDELGLGYGEWIETPSLQAARTRAGVPPRGESGFPMSKARDRTSLPIVPAGVGSSGRRAPRRPRLALGPARRATRPDPLLLLRGAVRDVPQGRRGGSRVRRRAPRSRHQQDEALPQGRRRLPAGLAPRPFGHAAHADRRGDPLRPVSWDVALDRVVSEIRRIQDAYGRDAFAVYSGSSLATEITYLAGSSRESRSAPSTSTTTAACAW